MTVIHVPASSAMFAYSAADNPWASRISSPIQLSEWTSNKHFHLHISKKPAASGRKLRTTRALFAHLESRVVRALFLLIETKLPCAEMDRNPSRCFLSASAAPWLPVVAVSQNRR